MAEVKYNDVNWAEGTPIAGERLATNGYYTGEHIGVPMQDALADGVEAAHAVENATIRYGTIMGDAAEDANMPDILPDTPTGDDPEIPTDENPV